MSKVLGSLLAACLSLSACGGDKAAPDKDQKVATPSDSKAAEPAKPQEAPKPAAAPANFAGSVTGIVKLAAGATMPLAQIAEEVLKNPAAIPPGCPRIMQDERRAVRQNESTQGLSPVHLALTQMTAAPSREPRTHEIFIENCRLTPGLIGAMRGDTLKLTNKSVTVFLPGLPGDSFMQGLMPGKSREAPLNGAGPFRVNCAFGAYCGESMVLTVAHSLYAVTDVEGRFTIAGVPLDQELVLHAWHPLFEVSSQPIKVTAAEPSKTIELTLTPVKRAPEAASGTGAPQAPLPANKGAKSTGSGAKPSSASKPPAAPGSAPKAAPSAP